MPAGHMPTGPCPPGRHVVELDATVHAGPVPADGTGPGAIAAHMPGTSPARTDLEADHGRESTRHTRDRVDELTRHHSPTETGHVTNGDRQSTHSASKIPGILPRRQAGANPAKRSAGTKKGTKAIR